MAKRHEAKINENEQRIRDGMKIASANGIFSSFVYSSIVICGREKLGKKVPAVSNADGKIFLNKDIYLSSKQWAYAIAHCILHNCFGHYDAEKVPGYMTEGADGKKKKVVSFNKKIWNIACDIYVDKFLNDIKLGEPLSTSTVTSLPQGMLDDELKIYDFLIRENWDENNQAFGVGAPDMMDMSGLDKPLVYEGKDLWGNEKHNEFASRFACSIVNSVSQAISDAADRQRVAVTKGELAAEWFINSFPLLGAIAASFKIIEDIEICHADDIQIAAVDAWNGEIYLNPSVRLSTLELRFVLAHEFLHAALMHHRRCEGRDPYLWNIATDYVINGWLVEMKIGMLPESALYDPELKGMSAEEIYDRIIEDIRTFQKQLTFRGYGLGDILRNPLDGRKRINGVGAGVSLDEFYRNALAQGLEYEEMRGRGLIPAGLVEEIRALAIPPIPWDVKLAEWFNAHIRPIEKYRSYAHPSRRQSSTPDIPRPRSVYRESDLKSRTFGVVIDTSGSMSTSEIGKALGAIASYSAAKDVAAARVIFCDADAYDAGYMSPEEIAGRVKVIGRGGTRLQPAISLLQRAKDFPKNGPILIITDGEIEDHLDIKNEHAYLLPVGCRLPFKARGEVFYFD